MREKNGPHGKWCSARGFLEEFVKRHAPGFDCQEDARQGEIEDGIRKQQDEQFAQEDAEDARRRMSWATKYYTPDAPDAVLLCGLAWEYRRNSARKATKIQSRRTWPTLRELKLATAIAERTLKKIIKICDLRPKNGEIVQEPSAARTSADAVLCRCVTARVWLLAC